jgi:flagellar biosynthesis protein FliQ
MSPIVAACPGLAMQGACVCSAVQVDRGGPVARAGSKGTVQTIRDLWELLVGYARQETVDPLKSLGRSLGWGVLGSVLVSLSVVFGGLAVLRLLQAETDVFDGNLSWLPYLVVAVLMLAVTALAVMAISRAAQRRRPHEERL